MPKGKNQKMKMYYLARIMVEETDENHEITMAGMIDKLLDYGVTADRKSVYDDIEALRDLGIEISGRNAGRNYYYHVANKSFQLAELKLLVDAVQSSRFITEKKSRELIRKLMKFASRFEAAQLRRQVVVRGRIKTMNESIYFNVDEIHNAISKNSTIRFEYLKWNLRKKLVLKRNRIYEVSPWALMWDHENYYMIGYDSAEEKIKHYRVDKMRKIKMTGTPREGKELFKEFDLPSYARKSFGMFGGESADVRILFRNDFVGVLLDRFGKDITITESDEEDWSETTVEVAISDQFFGWVFSLGDNVKLAGPDEVVEGYRANIRKMEEMYGK